MRPRALAFGLALLCAATVSASYPTPTRQDRRVSAFAALHGTAAAPRAPAASAPKVHAPEVHFVDGTLRLTAEAIEIGPEGALQGLEVEIPLAVDGRFLTAPVRTSLEAMRERTDMKITRFTTRVLGQTVEAREIRMRVRGGRFDMVGDSVLSFRAEGALELLPDSLTLSAEVEKIRAGILPVPRRVVLGKLAGMLPIPQIEVTSPFVYVDVGGFLK